MKKNQICIIDFCAGISVLYNCVATTTIYKINRKITNLDVQMFSRRKDTADKANNAESVFFLPRKSTRANANISPKHKNNI